MPILSAELKLYKSAVVTNDNSNGGRMSANEIATAVKNAIFPDVSEAQRTAGFSDQRKVFFKVANDADLQATNAKLRIPNVTPGGTRMTMSLGDQTNTQGDLTGSERKYGVGVLNADVIAGATTLVVDAEPGSGADLIFQAGDLLWLTDGTNEEYVTIDAGGVSWATDQATITLTAGTLNAYAAATPTRVASVIEVATVECTVDNWSETSASGTYDESGNPVECDNIGSIERK